MNANLCSLFWEGFVVNSFSHPSANIVLIQLQPDSAIPPCCRRCERQVFVVHDVSFRRVRERQLLGWSVCLNVPVRRPAAVSPPKKLAGCLNARDIPRRYPYGLSHWPVYCRLSTLHNSPACTGIQSRTSTTGVCCENKQSRSAIPFAAW